jgi:diguanylate cyclase (GGDEF)-like protein
VVLYILAVAILNLTIGFAVAVYLARRYEEMMAPLDDLPLLVTPPIQSGSASEAPAENSESPPTQVAEEESAGASSVSSENDSIAKPTPEKNQGEVATPSERETTPRETSVDDFRDQAEKYHEMLAGFDDRLRNLTQTADREDVSSCLTSLRQANEDYLGARDRVCGIFEQLHRERQELQQVCSTVEAVVEQQTRQLVLTNEAIDGFDFEADLKEGCRHIAGETGKLLEINDHLRDTLNEVLVAVARDEKWLETIEDSKRTDPLTGLANRTGLEAALAQWWEADPQRLRQLTAAMIDLDHFTEINQRHGHKVGNQVLCALSKLLTAESQEFTVTSRYAGQRFLLLFGDVDVRFTTNLIERVRQLVELAHLRHGEEDIRLTISCAVTEARPDDSSTTLYGRIEQTLQEAKRYGRNRTFLHEGKYPTPVVPPNFTLEERDIAI